MNDSAAIDEAHRDWLDIRRHPRGVLLSVHKLSARNNGKDDKTTDEIDEQIIKENHERN